MARIAPQDQSADYAELDRKQWRERSPPPELEQRRHPVALHGAEIERERVEERLDSDQHPRHPTHDWPPQEVPDHYRMFPYPCTPVYVATLSTRGVGFLTVDSQAGRIDPDRALAAEI